MYYVKRLALDCSVYSVIIDFCVSDRTICVSFKLLFHRTDTYKPVIFTSWLINTVHHIQWHSCCIQCIGQCVLWQKVGLLVDVQVASVFWQCCSLTVFSLWINTITLQVMELNQHLEGIMKECDIESGRCEITPYRPYFPDLGYLTHAFVPEVCIIQCGCFLSDSVTDFEKHSNLYMLHLAVYVHSAIPWVSVYSHQFSCILQPYMTFCSACASPVIDTGDVNWYIDICCLIFMFVLLVNSWPTHKKDRMCSNQLTLYSRLYCKLYEHSRLYNCWGELCNWASHDTVSLLIHFFLNTSSLWSLGMTAVTPWVKRKMTLYCCPQCHEMLNVFSWKILNKLMFKYSTTSVTCCCTCSTVWNMNVRERANVKYILWLMLTHVDVIGLLHLGLCISRLQCFDAVGWARVAGWHLVCILSCGVLAWLCVWSDVQTCMLPSWCCQSLSLASVKYRLLLPVW